MYFARLKGMDKKTADKEIHKWLQKMDAEQYIDMPAEKLSKGNQQKIQFIISVIHNPKLIFMDEPFSGLDPINTDVIRKSIIDFVNDGKYIVMSAHQMNVIEEFARDVVILDKGKTVLKGNLEKIKNSYNSSRLEIISEKDISDILVGHNYTERDLHYLIDIENDEDGYMIFDKITQRNIRLIKFEIQKPSLNDIFIEKVGK